MDFQFSLDFQSVAVARCSMPHEALANWLNSEVYGDKTIIAMIEQLIENCYNNYNRNYSERLIGKAFTLILSPDEVEISSNSLLEASQNDKDYTHPQNAEYAYENDLFMQDDGGNNILHIGDDLAMYDDESHCSCGFDDFVNFIQSYKDYLSMI